MKMYDIASHMAKYLAKQTGLEQSRVDTVRFGLEIILGEIIKWMVLLGAAALLGVLPGALFAMVSMGLYRLFSGGGHCQDYWRCLTFGLIVFLGAGKAGVYAEQLIPYGLLTMCLLAGSIVMFVLILVWAPGEVSLREITQGERTKFKIIALVYLAVWSAGTLLYALPYSVPVAVAGFAGMVVQTVSFTPPGYRLIEWYDIALSGLIGERRCHKHAENA